MEKEQLKFHGTRKSPFVFIGIDSSARQLQVEKGSWSSPFGRGGGGVDGCLINSHHIQCPLDRLECAQFIVLWPVAMNLLEMGSEMHTESLRNEEMDSDGV